MYTKMIHDEPDQVVGGNERWLTNRYANPIDMLEYGVIEEDCEIRGPIGSSGKVGIVAKLITGCLSQKLIGDIAKHFRTVKGDLSNAGKIVGKGSMMSRERKDHTLGHTKGVPASVRQWMRDNNVYRDHLGWVDHDIRNGDCRDWGWSLEHPEVHEAAEPLVREVSVVYREELPDHYREQHEFMRTVHPDFKFPDSVYADVTVNRNVRTTYHVDDKDFQGGMGNLVVLDGGGEQGGAIVMPRYRLAFNPRPTDVLLMNVHELHGNLAFTGERLTAVLYTREHLDQCGK